MTRKSIAALVLISFVLSFTLPARGRTVGARVRLTMTDGSFISGELLAIDRDQVTLSMEGTGYVLTRPLAHVAAIRLIRTEGRRGGGALWGVLAGCTLGVAVGYAVRKPDNSFLNFNPMLFALGLMPLGAILAPILTGRRGRRVDRDFPIQGQDEEALARTIYELRARAANSASD